VSLPPLALSPVLPPLSPAIRHLIPALAAGALMLSDPLAAAGTGPQPVSVLRSVRAAIATQRGVHVVFVGHSSSAAERIVVDVGTNSGSETATDGKAELSVRVTPTGAYVSGNRAGLTTLFSLASAQAKQVGTRWVYWKAGTSAYDSLKSDVTMPSVTALLPKVAGTTLSTTAPGGTAVPLYVLKWTSLAAGAAPKLSNALAVSALAPNLPVEVTSTGPKGVKLASTLSRWGEDVVVSVPPSALTIASTKIKG
jgi:hypothetical protein